MSECKCVTIKIPQSTQVLSSSGISVTSTPLITNCEASSNGTAIIVKRQKPETHTNTAQTLTPPLDSNSGFDTPTYRGHIRLNPIRTQIKNSTISGIRPGLVELTHSVHATVTPRRPTSLDHSWLGKITGDITQLLPPDQVSDNISFLKKCYSSLIRDPPSQLHLSGQHPQRFLSHIVSSYSYPSATELRDETYNTLDLKPRSTSKNTLIWQQVPLDRDYSRCYVVWRDRKTNAMQACLADCSAVMQLTLEPSGIAGSSDHSGHSSSNQPTSRDHGSRRRRKEVSRK